MHRSKTTFDVSSACARSEGPGLLAHLSIAVATLSIMLSARVTAQGIVRIGDVGRCKSCEISLTHVVTLGDQEGPGRVGLPHPAIVRDSKGSYYVAHADGGQGANRIWVFDDAGRFVRTIGRPGRGPGEFGGITGLRFRAGDTLEVYSANPPRRTVFAPDFTMLMTNPVEVGYLRSVFLPDGRAVVNQHFASPGRAGYPLQLVSDSGRIIRSFGTIKPEYRSREASRMSRAVAAGPDAASVWTIGRTDYLIELWDTSGVRRRALQRDVDWFQPYVSYRAPQPNGAAPQPFVGIAMSDVARRLWVTVLVPAEHWRQGFTKDRDGRWIVRPEYGHRIYDTILEVIDPSAPQVVATARFQEQQIVSFLGDDMIVSYREDAAGYPFLDVWRLAVKSVRP